MGKLLVFVIIVILGTVGIITISNMNFSKSNPNVNAPISPKPSETAVSSITLAPSASPTANIEQKAEKTAVIKTGKGDITLALYEKEAPNTVANFVKKVNEGFYNNLTFHRVEEWVIQGGDPKGDGTGGSEIPVEFNDRSFTVGSLGVASRGDGKVQNDAQFFITKKDSPFLNGQYTNFGMVTSGMDVVNKIKIGDKILGITIE